MQLPRRPIASAHKTVRRPAETNQRKKLAAKMSEGGSDVKNIELWQGLYKHLNMATKNK